MYCPCSLSMKDWHTIFSLCHIISDLPKSPVSLCASNKFTKSSFQQHLQAKSGCPFHSGIAKYLKVIYYSDHLLLVDSDVTMRNKFKESPNVLVSTSTKSHVPKKSLWKSVNVDDHVSVKKHVWGVRSTTASSSWGQRNDESVKKILSRRTQSVTKLS